MESRPTHHRWHAPCCAATGSAPARRKNNFSNVSRPSRSEHILFPCYCIQGYIKRHIRILYMTAHKTDDANRRSITMSSEDYDRLESVANDNRRTLVGQMRYMLDIAEGGCRIMSVQTAQESPFVISDKLDAQQIAEADTAVRQALVHNIQGKKQISYAGIKWIAVMMSQNGQALKLVGAPRGTLGQGRGRQRREMVLA